MRAWQAHRFRGGPYRRGVWHATLVRCGGWQDLAWAVRQCLTRQGVLRIFRRLHGGVVAQLVERLVRNEEVRGSIPLDSTTAGAGFLRYSAFRRVLRNHAPWWLLVFGARGRALVMVAGFPFPPTRLILAMGGRRRTSALPTRSGPEGSSRSEFPLGSIVRPPTPSLPRLCRPERGFGAGGIS